jgi:FAD/FMN-containing dehydrogenase
MTETRREEALRALEQSFGDRVKRGPVSEEELGSEDALASVLPMNAEEVRSLAEVAERFSVPPVALGGGTIAEAAAQKESILVRFDLMRRTRFPDGEELWAEAEPGASWLQLDDELRLQGKSLAVYPTSAPRATVGGWLATDGLGVGSFEYGWLRENVLSASVVLPGGELVEVGKEVRSFVGAGGDGIVVGAKLRTRRADADVPFGAAFGSAGELACAVAGVVEAGLPLWHLAFMNPGMARARNLEESYMLFGAYPTDRGESIERGLDDVLASCQGRVLPAAEAYRAWGERFFPVTPSNFPTPFPGLSRELISLAELPEKLSEVEERPRHSAVQGTVAKSGEVLLLILDDDENS